MLEAIVEGRVSRFVVLDLEMTAWEGSLARDWSGPGEFPEIVQIGAVRIESRPDWREMAEFETVIRPVFCPTLSDYFTALTGIDQARVETQGIGFAAALERFGDFVGDLPALCFGRDGNTLERNCRRHGRPSSLPGRMHDIRDELCRRSGIARVMSSELPAALGFAAQGRAHDGLFDARAVAHAIRRLIR